MSEQEVIGNLHRWEDRIKDALLELAEYNAKEAEIWAQNNRRWQDVTSQARQGLSGTAEKTQDGARFVLAHTAQHGLYLELAMGRKYAIIEEALRNQAPKIMRDLERLLK